MAAPPRVDDYLQAVTGLSKNKVRALLAAGHLSVNGKVCNDRTRELVDRDVLLAFNASEGRTIRFEFPAMDAGGWPAEADARSRSRSGSRSRSDDAESSGTVKARLRPSHEVLHQIKWDQALAAKSWLIGYEDRFTGVQEVSLATWDLGLEEGLGSIPTHRIRYFKADGVVVWDRASRLDTL